jgi:hypothetical protein
MKSYSFESTAHVAHLTDRFSAHDSAATSFGGVDRGPVLRLLWHVLRTERRTGNVPAWFSAALRKAFPMDCGSKSAGDQGWKCPDFLERLIRLADWARLAQGPVLTSPGLEGERFVANDQLAMAHGRTDGGLVLAFQEGPLLEQTSWNAIWAEHTRWFRGGDEVPFDGNHDAKVNRVYLQALDDLWPHIQNVLHDAPEKILLTGHGGGGAVATLAALRMHTSHPAAALQVATFGSPPAGDEQFAARYDLAIADHWRVEAEDDILPHFPLSSLMAKVIIADASFEDSVNRTRYKHTGQVLYLTRDAQGPHVETVVTQRDRRLRLFSILASKNSEKAIEDHSLEHSYLPRLAELHALSERAGQNTRP